MSLLRHGENRAKSALFAMIAALVAVNDDRRAACACDRGHTVGTRAWADQ
jgi:hypothetical protein